MIFLGALDFFLQLELTTRHSLSFIAEWSEVTPVSTLFASMILVRMEFNVMKWSIWYRPLMLPKLVHVWYCVENWA
jgi:hypothetical protein